MLRWWRRLLHTQLKVLDLYCCQGGAGMGYGDAGFRVFGSDVEDQPRYPLPFFRGDAILVLRQLLDGYRFVFRRGVERSVLSLEDIAAIHVSPPCQARTAAQKIQGNEHPNLIAPTRALLIQTGLPYVIENVVADPATDPDPLRDPILLCGEMFGLATYRHRHFETNWPLTPPAHPEHVAKTTKMRRPPVEGEYMHIVGNFSGVAKAREVMGMPWASRDGLREAIPPAYTEFIGRQLIEHIAQQELELAA